MRRGIDKQLSCIFQSEFVSICAASSPKAIRFRIMATTLFTAWYSSLVPGIWVSVHSTYHPEGGSRSSLDVRPFGLFEDLIEDLISIRLCFLKYSDRSFIVRSFAISSSRWKLIAVRLRSVCRSHDAQHAIYPIKLPKLNGCEQKYG
jgi:hypothetical protein